MEYHGADLSDPQQIAAMFKFIEGKFGQPPDILVNNAGEMMLKGDSQLASSHLEI